MGGTWMVIVYGFAGMRDYLGHLSFKPRLPNAFRKIAFPVRLRSRELLITLDQDAQTATYLMRSGRDELIITHYDERVSLVEGKPQTRELRIPE